MKALNIDVEKHTYFILSKFDLQKSYYDLRCLRQLSDLKIKIETTTGIFSYKQPNETWTKFIVKYDTKRNKNVSLDLNDNLKQLEIYTEQTYSFDLSIFYHFSKNLLKVDLSNSYLSTLDLTLNRSMTLTDKNLTIESNLLEMKLFRVKLLSLASGSFDSFIYLEKLDLSDNYIESLCCNLFWRLKSLKLLNISYNSLRYHQGAMFSGLSSLETLSAVSIGLTSINSYYFYGLFSLRSLFISNNYIKMLNISFSESLKDSKELRSIYFESSFIDSIEDFSFSGLKSLSYLTLSKNQIRTISSTAFNQLSNLQVLILSENKLIALDKDYTFKDLANLILLDLSSNKIDFISRFSLFGLKSLKTLLLNSNRLISFESALFDDLMSLDHLNLASNLLKNINISLFNSTAFNSLKSLTLDYNPVESIEENCWLPFKSILKVNILFYDSIGIIKQRSFVGLSRIKSINLNNAKIYTIESNAFNGLNDLEGLILSENYLTVLENYTFFGLKNLFSLVLTKNKISTIKMGAFIGLVNLKFLHLDSNSLVKLAEDCFIGLTNLKEINLDNLLLNQYSIVKNSFYGLENLFVFKLVNYNLIRIKAYSFNGLNKLTELEILKCNLSSIDENAFLGLDSLLVLDLSENELTHIYNYTFASFGSQMNTLSLDRNKISSIEPHSFRTLTNLSYLNLYNNQLKHLQVNSFSGLLNLRMIFIYNCHIERIDDYVFKDLKRLENIDFGTLYVDTLRKYTFYGLKSLLVLNKNINTLKLIEPFAFYGLSSLDKLLLTLNPIEVLYSYSFYGLESLEELSLSASRIQHIQNYSFVGLNNLKKLNLSYNSIQYLDIFSFDGLTSLTSLDLTSNSIKSIDKFYFNSKLVANNRNPMNVYLLLNDLRYLPRFQLNSTDNYNMLNVRFFLDQINLIAYKNKTDNNKVYKKFSFVHYNFTECNLTEIYLNKRVFLRRKVYKNNFYQSFLLNFNNEADSLISNQMTTTIVANRSTTFVSTCTLLFYFFRRHKIVRLLIGNGTFAEYEHFFDANCKLNESNIDLGFRLNYD